MALQKTKSTSMGVDGNYHRIIQLNTHFDRLDSYTTVELYLDKDGRDSGDNPLESSLQEKLGNDFLNKTVGEGDVGMTVKDLILTNAYKTIKEKSITENAKDPNIDGEKDNNLAFFADAVDC